jgi:hypothetical protein
MKPAWMCLPPAVLSAFLGTIVLPANARAYDSIAEPASARAYAYTPHVWGECVTLRLTDGRTLAGSWRGPLGSPFAPTDYASRYETWRGPWGSFTAPALGESLWVTRKTDEPVSGEFKGFAGGALLLATPDSCAHLMVKLDEVADVRRASDPATEAEWAAAREHWTDAPSLDGIALQSGQTTLAIPVAAIAADGASPPAVGGSAAGGGSGAGVVILAVLAAGVVAYVVAGYVIASAFTGFFTGLARIGQ